MKKKSETKSTHNISVKSDNLEYLFYDDKKASYNSKCNDIDRFMKKVKKQEKNSPKKNKK